MAMNQFGVGYIFRGTDQVSPVMNRIGAKFGMLGKQAQTGMGQIGKSMATGLIGFKAFGTGVGMAMAPLQLANVAGRFGEGLASIGAVTKATTEEMKQLHDASLAASMATQFTPEETNEALLNMATMGLDAAQSMEALAPVLDLAAGSLGQLGLAESANAVVGTLKSFRMEMGQAVPVTDKLLRITQLTNFQARDFGVGLAMASSTAALFNQSLDDTLIQMGLLRNMNIEASVAGTNLREAWRRLGSDALAQQNVMKMGVQVFDKQTGEMRSALDIMSDMAPKMEKMTEKEKNRIVVQTFGVRGMAAFNAVAGATTKALINGIPVILKGGDAINYMRKQLRDSAGAATEFREKLLDTFEGQKKLIGGAREALAVVVGEAATKVFKPLARGLFLLTSGLANFMNAIPMGARKAFLGFVAGFGVLLASTGAIVALSAAFKMLGISLTGVIFTLVKIALVMAPVMLLIGGLTVGIVALSRAWRRNVGGIGDSWADTWKKIKLGFKGVVDLFQSGKLSKATAKELKKAGNEGVVAFLDKAARAIERIKVFWEGLKQGFEIGVDALAPKIEKLKDAFGDVFGIFSAKGKDSKDQLKGWAEAGAVAGERLAGFGGIVIDIATKAAPLVKNLIEGLSNLTAEDMSNGIDKLIKGFQTTASIIGVIWTALKGIVQTIQLAGAAIGESLAWVVSWGGADFVETKKRAGALAETFMPDEGGIESEENVRARLPQRIREMKSKRENVVARLELLGANNFAAIERDNIFTQGQGVGALRDELRELNKGIKRLAGKPLTVSVKDIGGAAVAATREDDERTLAETG